VFCKCVTVKLYLEISVDTGFAAAAPAFIVHRCAPSLAFCFTCSCLPYSPFRTALLIITKSHPAVNALFCPCAALFCTPTSHSARTVELGASMQLSWSWFGVGGRQRSQIISARSQSCSACKAACGACLQRRAHRHPIMLQVGAKERRQFPLVGMRTDVLIPTTTPWP